MAIDLFCGLGGWSDGFIAEGWRVVGFDIEARPYPAQLVLQDILTVHGAQFRNAACIVASPPCVEYSFMAMPWSRGKQIAAALRGHGEFPKGYKGSRTIADLNALFDACFRIQREASEAAGRYIPMVVENVKGAQPWVGKSRANFGSFHLWGDVDSIGGRIVKRGDIRWGVPSVKAATRGLRKSATGSWDLARENYTPDHAWDDGQKVPGMNFHDFEKTGGPGRSFQSAAVKVSGLNWSGSDKPGYVARGFNVTAEQRLGDAHGLKGIAPRGKQTPGMGGSTSWFGTARSDPTANGTKGNGGDWFGVEGEAGHPYNKGRVAHNTESGLGNNPVNYGVKSRDADGYDRDHAHGFGWKAPRTSSHSPKRKQASAKIAMIPPILARHIARIFKPGADARGGIESAM